MEVVVPTSRNVIILSQTVNFSGDTPDEIAKVEKVGKANTYPIEIESRKQ
jgi:hypothetical protein